MVSLQTPGTLGLLGLYHNDVIFWELSFNGILLWGFHNDVILWGLSHNYILLWGLFQNHIHLLGLSHDDVLLWGLSHNDGLLTRELLKGAKKAGVLGEAGLAERPAMGGGEPGTIDVLAVCVRVQRAITLEPVLTIQYGLTPPIWPKLWKILKNIDYFMTSKKV